MSDDAHDSGPGKAVPPPVDGVTVEEGKNKEDATMQEELAVAVNNSTEPQAAVAAESPVAVPCPEKAEAGASPPPETPPKKEKKKKKEGRCAMESCRKKVGLTGFQCRCGFVYCSTHRYSDAHNCTFDYKALAREQICAVSAVRKGLWHDVGGQANPTIVASKMLDKI